MSKDYAKYVPAKRSSRKKSVGVEYIFIAILVTVILVGAAIFIQEKKSAGDLTATNTNPSYVNKIVALLHHKKAPPAIASKAATKKLAAASADQLPGVQFDFYSELPNMQVTLSEPSQVVKALPDNKFIKVASKAATVLPTAPTLKPAIATELEGETTEVAKDANVFSANELTTLLASESKVSAQQFTIQLGAFENEQGAQRLLEAIKSVGFEVAVVKVKHGTNTLYTVQQGPFASISVARSTQARMQKRGIVSVIRKTA